MDDNKYGKGIILLDAILDEFLRYPMIVRVMSIKEEDWYDDDYGPLYKTIVSCCMACRIITNAIGSFNVGEVPDYELPTDEDSFKHIAKCICADLAAIKRAASHTRARLNLCDPNIKQIDKNKVIFKVKPDYLYRG